MKVRWSLTVVLLGLVSAGRVAAEVPVPPSPHVYVTPTAGFWRWDERAVAGARLPDRMGEVVGGRAGYSPIEAFAGELVVLTGTNDFRQGSVAFTARLTQVELSFVVNFRSLVNARVYPFLDLGSGVSVRRANEDRVSGADASHLDFHLGGGFKMDLSRRLGVRLNVRDTFFTETQGSGDARDQTTVDSVELSGGLEVRFGLGRRHGPHRLR
jgi:hypothetical protein